MREALRRSPPLVLFGSGNERIYAVELNARCVFVPASFPGAIIRRSTGTPFMGYAGATYLVQEYCNALFDALFNMLPLGRDLDAIDPTHAQTNTSMAVHWDRDAAALLDTRVEAEPFLVRISAARQLREQVEREARAHDESRITRARVLASLPALPAEVS